MYLPLTLLISLHFSLPVWASVSLIPPSTFPTLSATSSSASASGSSTTSPRASASSVTVSGSKSASSSASTTSSAQFPSLSGVSSCVTNCLAVAIGRVNCSSIVDVNCFCVAPNFPAELTACVENDACSTDLQTAESLAQQFCNVASSSPSLSFQSIPTTSPSSSSSTSQSSNTTSTAPPSSSTTSSTSGARSLALGVGTIPQGQVLLGLGLGILGFLGTYACAVW